MQVLQLAAPIAGASSAANMDDVITALEEIAYFLFTVFGEGVNGNNTP